MFIPTKDVVLDISSAEFEKYALLILQQQMQGMVNCRFEHNKIIKVSDGNYQIDGYIEFSLMGVTYKTLVECKHYKTGPSFQSIVNKEVTQWDTWIKQVEQDSTNANKLPLLIIKYNNVPEFVFVKNKLEIDEILQYKGYYSYTLSEILKLTNEIFFNN